MSYMSTPDEQPVDEGNADPWTDGARPHHCGFYVEDHRLAYRRHGDGTSTSYWECPPSAM